MIVKRSADTFDKPFSEICIMNDYNNDKDNCMRALEDLRSCSFSGSFKIREAIISDFKIQNLLDQ